MTRSQGVLGGFIDRVKDLFAHGGAEPPAAGSLVLTEEAPPPPEQVKGRIRINNDKRFAIAIELRDASDWLLPERVKLELADGTSLLVEVEQKHSTASGRMAAGLEVRLVCSLSAKLQVAVVRLVIKHDDGPGWIVEVTG